MRPSVPLAVLVAAMLAGCNRYEASWSAILPGTAPRPGMVAVVGSLTIVPPVDVPSSARRRGSDRAPPRLYAVFTSDLDEPFSSSMSASGREQRWSAWVPIEGQFWLEVPPVQPLYLRGFLATDDGTQNPIELPVAIDVQPGDDVVYVGHIVLFRVAPRRVLAKDERDEARQAARHSGYGPLAERTWTTRLARPLDQDPPRQRQRQPRPPSDSDDTDQVAQAPAARSQHPYDVIAFSQPSWSSCTTLR